MATPLLPHPATTAGGALVFYGLLVTLAARHRVTLVCLAGGSPTDRAGLDALVQLGVAVVPIWRRPSGRFPDLGRRIGLTTRWLSTRSPLRVLKFYDSRVQAALDHAVERESGFGRGFDLVQVEDNAMAQYRYPSGVPAVLTEHEVRVTNRRPGLGEPRWHRFQRRVWRRFDRVLVFTERDAAGLRAVAPELAARARVNPFGVTLGPPPTRTLEKDGELVFVGGFRHPPNVDAARWLARSIFPLIHGRHPAARLTIVGADPPAAVRRLASESVRVTGFVPEVDPFVDRAAVVIAPLRTGAGMRVKLLQALARGKAVVTTPLGAEGLAPGAPLRLGDTAAEIADAALALLADAEARRALGESARRFVAAHHSWGGFAERLFAVYRELGLDA